MIHLLGDEDPKIRSSVWSQLEPLLDDQMVGGEPILDELSEAERSSPDPRVRKQAGKFLLENRRREVFQEWVSFCRESRGSDGGDLDLETGAFLIGRSEYPDADIEGARETLDNFAKVLRGRITTARSTESAVVALADMLAKEIGFRGNVEDYYDAENSYLHRVIDRRLGIPITLATVYLCVARRLGLSLEPVNLPMHFLLKFETVSGTRRSGSGRGKAERFVDAFHGGEILSSRDCAAFLKENGVTCRAEHLRSVPDRQVLARILGNLLKIYQGQDDSRRMNRVTAMLRLLEL